MAGRTIFFLLDRRNNQPIRHANGKLALYSTYKQADDHLDDWNTRFHTGRALIKIMELEVAKDFRQYQKGA